MKDFREFKLKIELEKNVFNIDTSESDVKNGDLVIAVLDRGWVFVGFLSKLDNNRIRLDNCFNIHQWGTTAGLGELSSNGPTKTTILNKTEPVFGNPIFLIKCSDKWFQ